MYSFLLLPCLHKTKLYIEVSLVLTLIYNYKKFNAVSVPTTTKARYK
jgi:hypothetical protein